MKKTHKVSLVLLGVIVLAVAGFKAMQPKEPEYQGRRLSEWLEDFDSDRTRKRAAEAIRSMGRSSLPYLVELIGSETPKWKIWTRKTLHKAGYNQPDWTSEEKNRVRAFWALVYLQKEAHSAIPALVTKLGEMEKANRPLLDILASMGPAAVPELTNALSGKSDNAKYWAAVSLRMFGADAADAIPALMELKKNPRCKDVAEKAIEAIQRSISEGPEIRKDRHSF